MKNINNSALIELTKVENGEEEDEKEIPSIL